MKSGDTGPMPAIDGALETKPNRVITVHLQGRTAAIVTRESGCTPESAWADLVGWARRKGHIE